MVPSFDIFEIENDGRVRWVTEAVSFEEAKARAQDLAALAENGAVILDQRTGRKLIVESTRQVTGSEAREAGR
jgi:hypothetical protein